MNTLLNNLFNINSSDWTGEVLVGPCSVMKCQSATAIAEIYPMGSHKRITLLRFTGPIKRRGNFTYPSALCLGHGLSLTVQPAAGPVGSV